MIKSSPRPLCACGDGGCTSECPCSSFYKGCSMRCLCKGCKAHLPAHSGRTKGCSCKKSNCLKLYCECLATQRMCDNLCNCEGCKNKLETLAERDRAVAAILERNPLAFHSKVGSGSTRRPLRGCNCRKTGCMKNYCECHQAGVACTSRCACHQCRNTETFVSAKKMLVFAGVSTDDANARANTDRSSQRKIVKRPFRAKAKAGNTPSGLQTPTSASPTALELLSSSAPVANSNLYQHECSAMDGVLPITPSKRASTHMEQNYHTAEQVAVTPTFAKRKYARRVSGKLPFMERIEEASADIGLPDVEDTVTNAYDARNTEGVGDPELTILCRSLLQTAMTVELAEEEKKAAKMSVTQPQQCEGIQIDQQHPGDISDGREALSPTSAGLFCEEEYSDAAGDDDEMLPPNENSLSADKKSTENASDQSARQDKCPNLSVMQERAVLQEFSVWLRNLAAGVSSY